ncbi:hypothetical protein NLM31_36865 [Bradyrhizobium sp. CCGUVB4N]|uniref:WD40 repeat domain-containing protein n=1 Tax=Bradyrhizobium sp. CCGUVB4N TaxID=2949631 RepID=UPI0020B37BDA|nr:hypothetical protein [Bradyrhizobium sp. CCGUVB4N]MCP3385975.1 hypothetical protein [Bradyrhizobium sp. CCGUVB4N]
MKRSGIKLWAFVALLSLAALPSNLAMADEQADSQATLPRASLSKVYKLAPSNLVGSFLGLSDQIAPTAVAWSPDGKKIAAISNYGNRIEVWNTEGGSPKVIGVSTGDLSNSFEFLDNDNILAPSNAPMTPDASLWGLSVWSAKDGSFVRGIASQHPEKDFRYNTYTLSPDRSLAVAVAPGANGFAKPGPAQEFGENPVPVYSTKTWEMVQSIPVVWPFSAAFSPDGRQIAFGSSLGRVFLYDVETRQITKTIQAYEKTTDASVRSLSYSPDGGFIAAGGYFTAGNDSVKSPRVVRVSDGQIVASYPEHILPWKVTWSPDGKYIAVASHDSTIRLWNPNKPDNRGTIIRNNGTAMCLAFSPDGKQLAACSSEGVAVFNLNY